jgi:hypothetical protein
MPPEIFEHNFALPVARKIAPQSFPVTIKKHAQGNAAHSPLPADAPADIVKLAPITNCPH